MLPYKSSIYTGFADIQIFNFGFYAFHYLFSGNQLVSPEYPVVPAVHQRCALKLIYYYLFLVLYYFHYLYFFKNYFYEIFVFHIFRIKI